MCQDTKMKIQSQVYFLVVMGAVSTEAWFWSWTGTTTLAPTSGVETEGSGSPAGSGDPPPESLAKLGAQIIDEGHGFQNIVHPWNETTVAPVLTTPIQLQKENGSETEPAGISSPISKPGNGTSLFLDFGRQKGIVLKLKPEFDSELGTKSDVWSRLRSESAFGSGDETNWEPGIETWLSSKQKQQEAFVSDDYQLDNASRGMSQEDGLKLKSQGTYKITRTRKDNSSSTETATTSNNTQENVKNNTSFTLNTVIFNLTSSQETSSHGDALLVIKSSYSGDTKQLIQNNLAVNSAKLAAEQKVSHRQKIPLPSTGTFKSIITQSSVEQGESQKCLLLDTALPFCSSMTGKLFLVPNYLNHSTVAQVQVLLHNWAWLLKSRCHHSLERFFCVLLVPKCGSLVPLLPCRSFCEVLKDSCWSLLDKGHLPVECHALPDEEDDDGYQCLSVSNQKGKHWLK